jgi:hypothetical protein
MPMQGVERVEVDVALVVEPHLRRGRGEETGLEEGRNLRVREREREREREMESGRQREERKEERG